MIEAVKGPRARATATAVESNTAADCAKRLKK
jgi:hypothetical protein